MARNTEKMKNEKCTLQDLEYGEKTGKLKQGKLKNVENLEMSNCRTWNMARKLKIMENEKFPLDDLKNEEITENREK